MLKKQLLTVCVLSFLFSHAALAELSPKELFDGRLPNSLHQNPNLCIVAPSDKVHYIIDGEDGGDWCVLCHGVGDVTVGRCEPWAVATIKMTIDSFNELQNGTRPTQLYFAGKLKIQGHTQQAINSLRAVEAALK